MSCNVPDCNNKPWKNGFCYRKHRSLADAAVEEPVAVEELIAEEEKIETNNIATPETETMPPQQREDFITENSAKLELFNDFVVGNVKLEFNNGKKKICSMTKWKDLNKSELITGPNFFIRTGWKSNITVFDVDVKPDCNGKDNLFDAGLDFDDYKDSCIVVRTQSGGWHYIFKYDASYKTGANCYGIRGFDIRNDDAIIFAGERYDVISQPAGGIECPPVEIFTTLNQYQADTEEKPAPSAEPVATTSIVPTPEPASEGVNQKYYELLNLLPDEFFNDHDKWVKPIYALRNLVADGLISNDDALATAKKLLMERSGTNYNEVEIDRVYGLEMKDKDKRYKMGSVVKVLKERCNENYLAWKEQWTPKVQKAETKDLTEGNIKRNHKLLTYIAKEIGMEVDEIEAAINDTEPEFAFEWRKKYVSAHNRPITDIYRRWGKMIDYIHNYAFTSPIQAAKLLALFIDQYYVIMVNGEHYKRPDLTKLQDNNKMTVETTDPLKTMLFHIVGLDKPMSASYLIHSEAPLFHKYENFNASFEGLSSPDSDPHEFNSCVPFKAKLLPKCDESKISGILEFFKEVVCDSDEELYQWFLMYLAKIFQFPDTKTEVVPIFYSAEEGCGKTTICDIITALVGVASIDVSSGSIESLVSERREHLVGRKAAFVNEINELKAQFKKYHEAFKSLATDKFFDYRPLYAAKRVIKNVLEIMITTNNLNSMPSGRSARRLQLFKISTKYKQDGKYFGALYETYINNPEAMDHLYTYLMRNVKVSRGPITNIIETEGQKAFIEANQDSVAAFWTEKIQDETGPSEFTKQDAYADYQTWCKNMNESYVASARNFGTKSMGIKGLSEQRTSNCRMWVIERD